MPTNIPGATTGPVTSAEPGIADSTPAPQAEPTTDPVELILRQIARTFGFDDLFRSVSNGFYVFNELFDYTFAKEIPTLKPENTDQSKPPLDPGTLNAEIASLTQQIDSMKSEGQRLLSSCEKKDQLAGQARLEAASQLLALLSKMTGEQSQLRAQQLR